MHQQVRYSPIPVGFDTNSNVNKQTANCSPPSGPTTAAYPGILPNPVPLLNVPSSHCPSANGSGGKFAPGTLLPSPAPAAANTYRGSSPHTIEGMGGRARVEVRLDESNVYYNALLQDIWNGVASVVFDQGNWGVRDLPVGNVRLLWRREGDMEPRIGQQVEVLAESKEGIPQHWILGAVQNIKHGFYYVSFDMSTTNVPDTYSRIFEGKNIRPPSPMPPLQPLKLYRGVALIPPPLRDWTTSAEALKVFNDVQQRTQLLAVTYRPDAPAVEGTPTVAEAELDCVVVLLGEEKHVKSGKLILELHLKHQKELLTLNVKREKKLKELQEKQSKVMDSVRAEFITDDRLVGLIIGKGGEHLRSVEKAFNVEIKIYPVTDCHPSTTEQLRHRVIIYGNDEASVEAARLELEFIYHDYPVDQRLVGWILGKKGVNIKDVSQRSGLYSAYFDDQTKTFILCGTKQSVGDAVLLLDSHAQYFDVYKEFNREDAEIDRTLSMLGSSRPNSRFKPSPDGRGRGQKPGWKEGQQDRATGLAEGHGAGGQRRFDAWEYKGPQRGRSDQGILPFRGRGRGDGLRGRGRGAFHSGGRIDEKYETNHVDPQVDGGVENKNQCEASGPPEANRGK